VVANPPAEIPFVPEADAVVTNEADAVAEAFCVVAEADSIVTEASHLVAEGWALPVVPEDYLEANAPSLQRLRCHDAFQEELLECLTPTGPTEPSVDTLCQEVFSPTVLAEFMTVFSKCQQERAKPRARRNPY
jgi:hypothetical protein